MAISRHYEVCKAIRESLVHSEFLNAVVGQWVIQKRYWNRYRYDDVSRGFIAPIQRQTSPFENLKAKWRLPCLVGVIIPSQGTLSLAEDGDMLLQISEYLEDMFAWQGKNKIPYPVKNIGQSYPDPDKFHFEGCSVDPAESYLDIALQNGFDAVGVVINIDIQFNKKDFSSLGAP